MVLIMFVLMLSDGFQNFPHACGRTCVYRLLKALPALLWYMYVCLYECVCVCMCVRLYVFLKCGCVCVCLYEANISSNMDLGGGATIYIYICMHIYGNFSFVPLPNLVPFQDRHNV